MQSNLHSEPAGAPLRARVGAVAQAARALLSGVLRRPQPLLSNGGRNDGPPDLDELWRDFNRKLSGLFNGKGGGNNPPPRRDPGEGGGGGPSFQPDMKSAGIGAGLIGFVVLVVWLGSGFFIVQEGQQAIVTTFGRYSSTVGACPIRSRRTRRCRSRSCARPRSAAHRSPRTPVCGIRRC